MSRWLFSVNWDNYRLPVAFRPIRPKSHPQYRKENDLFCDLGKGFVPPVWAHTIVVAGDAGYGSQDNMKMVSNGMKATRIAAGALSLPLPAPGRQSITKRSKIW